MNQIVFSGIQPSGNVHIGNYIGAIKKWIKLSEDNKNSCFYCIVDYHSIYSNIKYKQSNKIKTKNMIYDILACGLDIDKVILFTQSKVSAHCELAWILNSFTNINELSRMTQYKSKVKTHVNDSIIPASTLNYPILQAADIMLYKTNIVPVGKDQIQHIELTNNIIKKFNSTIKKIFPIVKIAKSDNLVDKVIGIDGFKKMSKSLNNDIGLDDSKDIIYKKIRTAYTDPNRKLKTDSGTPSICNMFKYHKYFSSSETINYVEEGCSKALIGCKECKTLLSENIYNTTKEFQSRKKELLNMKKYINEKLYSNNLKCNIIANNTLGEVKELLKI